MDHSGSNLLCELFCGTPPSCFDDVLAEDGELLHVLPLAVHLNFFFDRQVGLGWTGLGLGLGGLRRRGLGFGTRA